MPGGDLTQLQWLRFLVWPLQPPPPYAADTSFVEQFASLSFDPYVLIQFGCSASLSPYGSLTARPGFGRSLVGAKQRSPSLQTRVVQYVVAPRASAAMVSAVLRPGGNERRRRRNPEVVRSCARHSASTTLDSGSSPIRVVPMWWYAGPVSSGPTVHGARRPVPSARRVESRSPARATVPPVAPRPPDVRLRVPVVIRR